MNVEFGFRNGECCKNNTIPYRPIYQSWLNLFGSANFSVNCTATLDKLIHKLELTEPLDISSVSLSIVRRIKFINFY